MRTLRTRVRACRDLLRGGFGSLAVVLVFMGALNLAGCPQPDYTQLIPGVTLEDIATIAQDNAISPEERAEQLREELGIEDEQLIEAILDLYGAGAAG